MKTNTVTVHYISPTLVEVDPKVVSVAEGDAIMFEQVPGMVGKMRVRFNDKERQFFDTANKSQFAASGDFHLVDGHVRVVKTLPHRITYKCELLNENDVVIASSDDNGGAADPVKTAP